MLSRFWFGCLDSYAPLLQRVVGLVDILFRGNLDRIVLKLFDAIAVLKLILRFLEERIRPEGALEKVILVVEDSQSTAMGGQRM